MEILVFVFNGFLATIVAGAIIWEINKAKKDINKNIQEVKTSQRASQKRERKLLKEVRK